MAMQPGMTRMPVSKEVRDLVRAQKRGGQSYDELLRHMVKQYSPDEAQETPTLD